jgi:hypothetical protein
MFKAQQRSPAMDHKEKVAAALDDLTRRGVWRMNSAPPLYHVLWWLGIEIPPPYYGGFWPTAALTGVFFGVVWGLLMWFILWKDEQTPFAIAIVISVIAGVAFGCSMAAYYRWRARQLGLPPWEAYSPGESNPPR